MKHFFALISLLFFMLCLLLPAVSSAEEANGTLYFGGGTSESANFQVSGVVTDTSDNLTFPADTAGTTVPSNIPELKPPASQPLPEPQGILSQIIKIIIQIAKDVADNSFAQAMNIVIAAVAGIVTIILALAETVLNLPWLNLGSNTWSRFLMIFGFFKNKKRWGIVYDAESRQPISLAVVRIFDALERRLLETQLTDKDGRFGFLAKPGKYYLEVQKANYIFPSRLTVNDYHGKNIELGQDEMLSVNIPMDPQIYKITAIIGTFSKIFEIFERLQLPLAIIGTVICVCVYIRICCGATLSIAIHTSSCWTFAAIGWIIPLSENAAGPSALVLLRFTCFIKTIP